MLNYLCGVSDKGWAQFIVRWVLGLLFLMRGWFKTFDLTMQGHAERFFVTAFADDWIPEPLLWALGYVIPPFELIGGLLICIGLFVRETAIAFGLLLILTTYGHALQDPFFDIDGYTFTYLAMIVFLLLMPRDEDALSLAAWRRGNTA